MKNTPTNAGFAAVVLSLIFLDIASHNTRSAQTGPVNPNFEEGTIGQPPVGWSVPSLASQSGYSAVLTDEQPKSGSRCAVIIREGPATGRGFGNLTQSLDAAPYRGKRIRFRSAVRVEVVGFGNQAQLWMRADRLARGGNQTTGFFDNMDDRPINSREWAYYEIVGDIESDADKINIGLMLMGAGKAWLDDVTLEIVGEAEKRIEEPARPLAARGLENMTAFTRLLGYVRHFHPSDEAARTDWEVFTIEGMRAVESAKDSAELAQKLETLFRSVAPTIRVFPSSQPLKESQATPPTNVQSLKVVMWRHNGFGTGSKMSIYRSERVQESILDGKTPANFPNPNEPFQSDLGGGVTCSVPIALYADAEGTLPHTPTVKKDSALIQSTRVRRSADDRATRLAAVSLAWNVFQHFYPYFDVVKTDWPAELKQALQSAATDADERAFTLTLRRLVAALRDGHGNVGAPNAEMFAPGVVWDWIEERLVITEVKNSTSGLAPGDVVLTINGQPSARLLEETERSISGATPQWIRSRALREIAMGAKDTSLTLEIEPWASPGKRTQVAVKRDAQAWAIEEKRPARVAEIEAGVFYLDFDRISDQDFKEALPKLEQAKGIIFDLRGYPRNLNAMQLFPHLTEKPMTSAQWHVPVVTRPDRQNMQFMRGGEWQIAPRAPYLKARKAFITGGGAISYAESCMGIVEHYKLAEIVGGPTAGTNGNVNPFTVPGGYTIVWTGMKVLKQDGSQHHGVGIRPTIPVARTRAGVAAGRDELLERALQTVKGQ